MWQFLRSWWVEGSVQFSCSVQLCDPMDCRSRGFPVHHQLPELGQTHVHWVSDTIHLILCRPLLLPPSIFPSVRVFSNESVFRIRWPLSIGVSASTSFLPMNIQGWSPLGLTGLISLQSKWVSRVFCSITVRKHQFFGTEPSLWSNSRIHMWILYGSVSAKWYLCFLIRCLGLSWLFFQGVSIF